MKKLIILCSICLTLILSACSFGASTEEDLNELLTIVYEDEAGYRDAQAQLEELEKKEQADFTQMMALTQEQKEELQTKVDEVNTSLQERIGLLELEKQSIQQAKTSFQAIDDIIENEKEETVKQTLSDLKKAMLDRYDSHENFTAQYTKLSELQNSLYSMLVNEETELPALQEKVTEVNAQNEIVQKAIDEFNTYTSTFNELKKNLYDLSQNEK